MKQSVLQIPVCKVPDGNGFRVEHMPEFLEYDDFDNCSPHIHSFYEILWFQQGCGRHTVDFHDYEVEPNTLFFLAPGQIHNFDNESKYVGVSIKMCVDFMKNESDKFLKYDMFHNNTPCYTINDELAHVLTGIVDSMEDESHRTREYGNIDVLQSLLRIMLIKIQRYGKREGQFQLDTLRASHQLFVNFRSLVENEYSSLHTVQEYSDRLNVAVRTLNKCVNECSGISPLAFINDRILLEAKRLVRFSNMMIKEIAFNLGYDDPSYFVKFFKRQTGYLPSDFRELDTTAK